MKLPFTLPVKTPFTPSLKFLLVLMCMVLTYALPGQSNDVLPASEKKRPDPAGAALQLFVNQTQFQSNNRYVYQVVPITGIIIHVPPGTRDFKSASFGVGYQHPLTNRLAVAASFHLMSAKREVTIDHLLRLQQQSPDPIPLSPKSTHSLHLGWLDLQFFMHHALSPGVSLALGYGVGGVLHQQNYLSAFRYNELLQQTELEERTEKWRWGFYIPISMRLSFVVDKRWIWGIDGSAHLFFSDETFSSIGTSVHYFLNP